MKITIDHLSHAQRAANVQAAQRAAHEAHTEAHARATKLRTDADSEREASLKAIEKAAADAYEARRAALARDVYATLRPLGAAYLGDVRGATAEALRVAWTALAARARAELGGALRIDVLVYALFPDRQLSTHALNVLGELSRSTEQAQSFADALRNVVVFSERGIAYVSSKAPSDDEKAALTPQDVRDLEQRQARGRIAEDRARAALSTPPKMPSIRTATRLLIG